MPSESPTSRTSAPAAAPMRALGASYAVTMTSRAPLRIRSGRVGFFIGLASQRQRGAGDGRVVRVAPEREAERAAENEHVVVGGQHVAVDALEAPVARHRDELGHHAAAD